MKTLKTNGKVIKKQCNPIQAVMQLIMITIDILQFLWYHTIKEKKQLTIDIFEFSIYIPQLCMINFDLLSEEEKMNETYRESM